MSDATLITGDVRDVLATIPDGSVDLVLTSPPFLALRSYLPPDHPDKHREIGAEPTPAEFIDTLLGLSAEWRRVLAPHGSIAVELGDTYSGSGGGGGDYLPGGMRDGQQQFAGAAATMRESNAAHWRQKNAERDEWPLAKSLCLIPELYRVALVYGINPLTGRESPAGRWRARNVVRWCRPNPPVGALGDKVRPATSDMVVACVSPRRWFDLDAVRGDPEDVKDKRHRTTNGPKNHADPNEVLTANYTQRVPSNPAGAPPLDHWWIDEDDTFDQDAWLVSTEAYRGSHYATWPRALLTKPILSMCPLRVCRTCGEPSRRIAETTNAVGKAVGRASWDAGTDGIGSGHSGAITVHANSRDVPNVAERVTLGWSDCGHGSYRCSTCHVVVPLDHALRRSRQSPSGQEGVGAEAVLAEPVQVAGEPSHDTGDLRYVRSGVPGEAGGAVLHPELFGEAGAPGGAGEHNPTPDTLAGSASDGERLRAHLGAGDDAGATEERPHDGTPARDAGAPGAAAGAVGDRAPSQRGEERQPGGEPGDRDPSAPCRDGDLPPLPGDVPGQLTGPYVCPCGGTDIEYVADHWRPGVVLDPFAGSGTTLQVATGHGRAALGIDLDARNADLATERVGMFLTTYSLDEWKPRASALAFQENPDARP